MLAWGAAVAEILLAGAPWRSAIGKMLLTGTPWQSCYWLGTDVDWQAVGDPALATMASAEVLVPFRWRTKAGETPPRTCGKEPAAGGL